MDIQLWSYNYAPEPTGIGPVSTVFAEAMRARGHGVEVVAAHPHYPARLWGTRFLPYREERNGIVVTRLPLWMGRETSFERIRQELSYMCCKFAALPALGRPDVLVATSPSFPALLPTMLNARMRRLPWVLWLHDILPDGAVSTGVVESTLVLRLSRMLERAAYREAGRIVVLSESFSGNLRRKGVPGEKIELIYDPATRAFPVGPVPLTHAERPKILSMGNIGYSQGLAPLVRAFEASDAGRDLDADLVITGSGMAMHDVAAEVKTPRVRLLGLVSDGELESELQGATLALVSQHHEEDEFNLPSKLMNFMGYGLPVVAAVHPESEVARLVHTSGGGWVVDSASPDEFVRVASQALVDRPEIQRRARAAFDYAREHFNVERFAQRFEAVLRAAVA